jgi:hypothetical protein
MCSRPYIPSSRGNPEKRKGAPQLKKNKIMEEISSFWERATCSVVFLTQITQTRIHFFLSTPSTQLSLRNHTLYPTILYSLMCVFIPNVIQYEREKAEKRITHAPWCLVFRVKKNVFVRCGDTLIKIGYETIHDAIWNVETLKITTLGKVS